MDDHVPLLGWEALQAAELFKELPVWLERSQGWMMTSAFLLIVAGHLWRGHELPAAGAAVMRHWYTTLLITAFVLVSPALGKILHETSQNWLDTLPGVEPTGITRRCLRLASTYPSPETVSSLGAEYIEEREAVEEGRRLDGWAGYAAERWGEGMTTEDEAEWLEGGEGTEAERIGATVAVEEKSRAVLIAYLVTQASLAATGAAAWLMETIRYLVIYLGLWMAPMSVAALGLKMWRGFGLRCLVVVLGALAWPFGWKIGHMATSGIFDHLVEVYVGPGRDFEPLLWANIDRTLVGDASREAAWFEAIGVGVPTEWLVDTSLVSLGLLVWTIVVCCGVPWLIDRLLGRAMPLNVYKS